ncbi:MAG: hypothetical protein KGI08_04320, partial [Thaumarchaeota archaeon]|nr:hypothetical protein [Nitrososphaerota archaeon]
MNTKIYPLVRRTNDMPNLNQVKTPGTIAERSLLVSLIESHPYWTNIWDNDKLTRWINGTIESKNLNTLFNLYFTGNITEVWNWIWSESGMNSKNPIWTQWG